MFAVVNARLAAAGLLLLLAAAVGIHQELFCGARWDWRQVLDVHHEHVVLILIALAIIIVSWGRLRWIGGRFLLLARF